MEVIDALNARFTCRAFKPDQPDKEVLFKILEAALRAPSWGNTQPWELYLASGEALNRIRQAYVKGFETGLPVNLEMPAPEDWPQALKERYGQLGKLRLASLGIERHDDEARQASMAHNFYFFGAPAVVFLCMDRTLTPWSMFDLGSLSQSIMLAAEHYGLGSAIAVMFAIYPDVVRAELAIPDDQCLVIGIALGYKDLDSVQNRLRSPRRNPEEVVRFKDV